MNVPSAAPEHEPLLRAIAVMVLDAVAREYPHHSSHRLDTDDDAGTPRTLHPVFYGSFDWHSAVHGHWCLVRLLRAVPALASAPAARQRIERHFTEPALTAELAYLAAPGRAGFERPYGLAWLLQLAAELREWEDPMATVWSRRLAPLERLAAERLLEYARKLPRPVRSGEHSQTAFALGLARDWATASGEGAYRAGLDAECVRLYAQDHSAPVAYEPGGTDFLSPALAEADLLRRVLEAARFAAWLEAFVPDDEAVLGSWLVPVEAADRADGKLAHWDGLNLSRAWMLEGIAAGLPPGQALRSRLQGAAEDHAAAGLPRAVTDEYAGSHWLGSFAVYLVTRRGQTA